MNKQIDVIETLKAYADACKWVKENEYQFFVGTATGECLDYHALNYGLKRQENESDEELRKRVLVEFEKSVKYLNSQGV